MDRNNSDIPVSGNAKNIARPKSLTPAVLGMTNSHGAKLSLHMASEDKKQLLSRLEEWRKARREKLAASILSKLNQNVRQKAPVPVGPGKSKPVTADSTGSKIQDRQSVFERLYKNGGKIKKAEVTVSSSKPSQIPKKTNFRKSSVVPVEKLNKPAKDLLFKKENTDLLKTVTNFSSVSDEEHEKQSVLLVESPLQNFNLDLKETENHVDDHKSPKSKLITEVYFSEIMKPTKSKSHLKIDQVKVDQSKEKKPVKTFKSLPFKAPGKAAESEHQIKPLRRSISMMFRKKCKTEFTVRRSISAKNLLEMNSTIQKDYITSFRPLPLPARGSAKSTKNDSAVKAVSFVTPKNNKPLKPLTSTYLRTKLEDWLKVNGHPLEGYRHLRCFGITNKERSLMGTSTISLGNALNNSHYETAPNTPADESDKENVTPPTVIQQVNLSDVENWLKELHRLIVKVKYPSERCEEWLAAVRKKCNSCTQLPIYWECLAALHESKGDLKSAIEDYERAIIKGGEVDVVGDSLAQLFDKMVIEQKKGLNRKLEKGLDPKNIFKSTIIKFALQQKALKNLSSEIDPNVRQQLYIATPVRRSTRIQTPFKSTEEVASLQTLSPNILKNVTFKPNESLLRGD